MFDSSRKLAIWNSQYERVLELPENFLKTDLSILKLAQFLARRGDYGSGDPEVLAVNRINQLWDDTRKPEEITVRGDKTYEVLTQLTGDGGLVITYTDVTERNRADAELQMARDDLEHRVEKRTSELHQEFTERRQVEKELSENRNRMQAVLDHAPVEIYLKDKEGRYLEINKRFEELFNVKNEEVFGLFPQDIHGMEFGEQTRDHDLAVLTTRVPVIREEHADTELGPRVLHTIKFPVFDDHGEVFGLGAVVSDITDLKQAEEKLRIARDKAEAANALQSQLVTTMSHELRTPLTSIVGSLGLLSKIDINTDPDTYTSLVDMAYRNGQHLAKLVDDILDVDKLEADAISLEKRQLDLAELIRTTVDLNAGYAQAQGVTISLTDLASDTMIMGDGMRLTQVMANLISNAAKFSPENGTVSVSLTRNGKSLTVSVSDNGPGIPDDIHDTLFERFVRGENLDNRNKGGAGLGLNISKALIEQHGGTIGFNSEKGAGTTFFFTLPILE